MMPSGKPMTTTVDVIYWTTHLSQRLRSGKLTSPHCGQKPTRQRIEPMHISSFFLELRSAYQAELDDLTFDSEGRNVLRERLTAKRQELGFLFQLMDLHPEMVAVVLHQAFTFTVPNVMDHFLTHHDDELLAWGRLKYALKIEVWAQPIVDQILLEPMGEWFMSVAAALEYMHSKPLSADNRPALSKEDDDKDGHEETASRHEGSDDHREATAEDGEEADERAREEAGNDWLAGQGFDRKDRS